MRNKFIKRVIAILLVILAVVTSIPFTASAANVELAEVAESKTASFRDTGIKAVETSKVSEEGKSHTHLSVEGENAYCIMPGYDLWGSTVLTPHDSDTWDNFGKTENGRNIRNAVTTVLAFGAEGNLTKLQSLVKNLTYDEAYVATQVLVWEFVEGVRTPTYPYALKKGTAGYIATFCKGGANPRVLSAYNKIIELMGEFQTIPSFTEKLATKAPVQTVSTSKVGGNWQKEFLLVPDDNKILEYFDFTGTYDVGNGKVKVTQSGNELTVTITEVRENGTPKTVSVKAQKNKSKLPLQGKGEIIAYGAVDPDDGAPNQQIVRLDTTKSSIDPPTAYMNLAIELKTAPCDARIKKEISVGGTKDKITDSSSLEGWYYRIYLPKNTVSAKYIDSYGDTYRNYYIVGPTDSTGLTVNSFSEVIANRNGTLEYGMPEGEYIIEELGKKIAGQSGSYLDDYYMPEGFEPAQEKITVTLTKDKGTTVVYSYLNNFDVPLKIKKVCEDGVKPNDFYFKAVFGSYVFLLKADGSGYLHQVNRTTGEVASSSTLYLPQGVYKITELGKLKSGKTTPTLNASDYEIPAKYGTPMDVEVTVSAQTYKRAKEAGDDTIYVEFHNTVSYPIGILKTDANTGKALAGAVFGIYADEHCTNLLDTITTGTDGKGLSNKQFRYGTYYLKEITPPLYYELSDKVYEVIVHHQSSWITIDGKNAIKCEATNTLLPTFVKAYKTDGETKTPLAGAVFGLYSNEACTDKYLLEKITTGKDGYGKSEKAYPPGTYYFKELTAPTGYKKSGDEIKITITETTTEGAEKVIKLTNEMYKTSIEVVKKENGKDIYLAGAVYGLYSDKACTKLLETLPATDSNGKAVTANSYRPGTYYLKEITPPPYYQKSSEVLTVKITTDDTTAGKVVQKIATDELIPVYVKVYKTDGETKTPLAGAVFGLYSNEACTDKYLLEKITTGTDGYGKSSKAYAPGTYYLKEITAPKDYKLDSKVRTLTLSKTNKAGTEYTVNATNTALKIPVEILKKENGKDIYLAGAVYGLYSDKACTKLLETLPATDSNGKSETVNSYRPGTYYLKEITAPTYYLKSSDVITVTVTSDNVTSGTNVIKTVTDNPIPVYVKVFKTDKETYKALAGAVFGLYSNKACTDKYLLEEITTGTDGFGKSSKAYAPGTYYLKEITAPKDYKLDSTVRTFTLSKAKTTGTEYTVNATNTALKIPVGVLKLEDGKETPLAGAVYGLYSDRACTKLLETLPATNSEGKAETVNTYRPGTYYLKEITAPTYYLKSTDVITVTVTSTNVTSGTTVYKTVTDVLIPVYVEVYKTDSETKTALNGAVFGLYSNKACTDKYLLEEIKTGTDGYGKSSKAYAPGTYYLKEITAPSGFELDDTVSTVILSKQKATGKVVTIERENMPLTVYLSLYKKDRETKESLAGAVYGLYSNKACTKLLEEVTVGDTGYGITKNTYRMGIYYWKEIKAPTNYELSDEVISVTVSLTDVNNNVEVQTTAYDSPKTGSITIIKTNADGEPLKGVKFEVYNSSDDTKVNLYTDSTSEGVYTFTTSTDKNSTYTVVTNSEGKAQLTKFPLGEYYLKEVSSVNGYMPYGNKIPFTIEVNSDNPTQDIKVEIEVPNHLPIVWNAGGNGTSTFYTISLIALSLSIIAVSLFIARNARKTKKNN